MATRNSDAEFNLLASNKSKIKKKTEKEIRTASSVRYSIVLIVGAIFFYIVLELVQLFVVDARRNSIQTKIDTVETSLTQFNDTIGANGELVTKSRLLQNVLLEDIKLEIFLDLVDEINTSNGQVLSYEKTNTGLFIFSIQFENDQQVIDAATNAIENSQTEEVFIRQIATDRLDPNKVIMTIELKINNEQ